jgi:hypothetical protein
LKRTFLMLAIVPALVMMIQATPAQALEPTRIGI